MLNKYVQLHLCTHAFSDGLPAETEVLSTSLALKLMLGGIGYTKKQIFL